MCNFKVEIYGKIYVKVIVTLYECTKISVFDFWSRGHLRMAVLHLPIKYGTDIFIQSGVIDIFSEIKDGGFRHVGFVGGAVGPPMKAHSWNP